MAELVGNDPLKFLAVEQINGALVDADHRIVNTESRGEGIDAVFSNQIHRRHWHTRRDGHFFYDV